MYFDYADWPAPANIIAGFTHRKNGDSIKPFEHFNLALHVGDDERQVIKNRRLLDLALPGKKRWQWLNQVHGNKVVTALGQDVPVADASFTHDKLQVCAVMTADCLPILLCDQSGRELAAIHAGWRSLCGGIIENTVSCFSSPKEELLAYLGPAIGPLAFEVGEDVRQAFGQRICAEKSMLAFSPLANGKYLADLYRLASIRLKNLGVERIYGGGLCTYKDSRFYSYRREGETGRMVSFIYRTY